MIDKETYEREITRMFDSVRTKNKGCSDCRGVPCSRCPLEGQCRITAWNVFKMIEFVEQWSKEHPQKNKISKLEYDILKIYSDDYFYYFYESEVLKLLLKKGYFEGATLGTDVKEYFENCEVDCELGGNKKC